MTGLESKALPLLAVATLLVAAAAVAGPAFATQSDDVSPDEGDDDLPDEYELTVVDPDDRLSETAVDDAVALAWTADETQAELDDPVEITVQATTGTDDVTVVLVGDGGAAAATVDLETDTVVDVLPSDRVVPADDLETVDGETIDRNDGGAERDDVDEPRTVDVRLGDDTANATTADDRRSVTVRHADDVAGDVRFDVTPAILESDDDVAIEDEADLLDDDRSDRLERLLVENASVDDALAGLDGNATAVDGWTATISEYDGSVWADGDGVVAVELGATALEETVVAYVDLDEDRIEAVVPVLTLEADDADANVTTIDGDDRLAVETDDRVEFELDDE